MDTLGSPISPGTPHNISINLPTWNDVERFVSDREYVEGGYPRMKLHKFVERLTHVLCDKYAKDNEQCLCFPSYEVAKRCREFVRNKVNNHRTKIRILQLATSKPINDEEKMWKRECKVAVVFVSREFYPWVLQYWRLSGEIISSRVAEYVLHELFIIERSTKTNGNGETLNQKNNIPSSTNELEKVEFIESRFGRTLNFALADRAKRLIKKRIATKMIETDENDANATSNSNPILDMDLMALQVYDDSDSDSDLEYDHSNQILHSLIPPEPIAIPSNNATASDTDSNIATDRNTPIHSSSINPDTDVYLFPSGMASLYTAHRLLLSLDSQRINRSRNSSTISTTSLVNNNTTGITSNNNNEPSFKRTVVLGIPSIDTLKMIENFNSVHFISNQDSDKNLAQLQEILHSGEQILAVFVEAPSITNLQMINLIELKRLSELFGFIVVIDETCCGFVNVDGLVHADIVCSSLSKIFSGDEDVMAGSLIVNRQSKIYNFIQEFMSDQFEDNLWCEDAIYLEKNSRDFINKSNIINRTTTRLLREVDTDENKLIFKRILHPSVTSKKTYDMVKCKNHGGYGDVFYLSFHSLDQSKQFYNSLKCYKGPSLGTNNTIACPYNILYDYEAESGIKMDKTMIRVSIGLEPPTQLIDIFNKSIDALKGNEETK